MLGEEELVYLLLPIAGPPPGEGLLGQSYHPLGLSIARRVEWHDEYMPDSLFCEECLHGFGRQLGLIIRDQDVWQAVGGEELLEGSYGGLCSGGRHDDDF